MTKIEEFIERRRKENEISLKFSGTNTKRFFNIDEAAYKRGVLSEKQKELIGLVASMVMRCDDCILYHLAGCYKNQVTTQELEEAVNIALIVGGSIIIPHLRRMWVAWDEMLSNQ